MLHFFARHKMLRPSLLPFLVLLNDLPEVDSKQRLVPMHQVKDSTIRQVSTHGKWYFITVAEF